MTKILSFDDSLTETYLNAPATALPLPHFALVAKLHVFLTAPEAELGQLSPADRFLVECLRIYRLKNRVRSRLYHLQFEDSIVLLEVDAKQIYDAAKSLLNAPHFSELLNLILMLGNFLNASGHEGGASGFKITSINKLFDEKSVTSANRTFLHFTAKTVSQAMPETEGFLDELSLGEGAYKAELGHVRTKLADLRASQDALDLELLNYDDDAMNLDSRDQFRKVMVPFAEASRKRIAALASQVGLAQSAVDEALAFYGERVSTTQEFFGVFKTFKARDDNLQAAARAAKSAEQAAKKAAAAALEPSDTLVDEAMRRLKEGVSSGTPGSVLREQRRLQTSKPGTPTPLRLSLSSTEDNASMADIDDRAHSLLGALRGEGFGGNSTPSTPVVVRSRRRRQGLDVSRPGSPALVSNGTFFPAPAFSKVGMVGDEDIWMETS